MNPRERLMLIRLVTRLVQQPEIVKDADAELEVEALLKARPDAPYLLMQRALMLEAALEQARQQIEQRSASSLAGSQDWGARNGSVMPPPIAAAQAPVPAAVPASTAGGFLQNAATIGAGVLGGSLLFQGIESLLHGGSRGYSGSSGQMSPDIFETTNNYFEPATGSGSAQGSDLGASSASGGMDDVLDFDAGDGSWL